MFATFYVVFCPFFADAVKQTGGEAGSEENSTEEKEDIQSDAGVIDSGQLQETSDHKDEDDEDTDVGSPQVPAVAQFSALMEVAADCVESSKRDAVEKRPKQRGDSSALDSAAVIQSHKRLKRKLFIMTQHKVGIFRVSPFFKLQNDEQQLYGKK